MKKILLSATAFLSIVASINAQNIQPCNTYGVRETLIKTLPGYAAKLNAAEAAAAAEYQAFLQNSGAGSKTASLDPNYTFTVPVVFHVLHLGETPGSGSNINDQICIDALAQVNKDYSKQGSDTSSIDALFQPLYKNARMHFKLAQKDPNGNCTNGIIHHYNPKTNWDQSDIFNYQYSTYAAGNWSPAKYLNIYIVKNIIGSSIGIIVGYTYLPGTSPVDAADAIVYRNDFLSGLDARSLSHEIGHWFGLSHTFGSTNEPGLECSNDDIADTPKTTGFFSTCPKAANYAGTPSVTNPANSSDVVGVKFGPVMSSTTSLNSLAGSIIKPIISLTGTLTTLATETVALAGSGVAGGYSDFSAIYGNDFNAGTTNVISVESTASPTVANYVAVYCDYNRDGDFLDGNELLLNSQTKYTSGQPLSGTGTIIMNSATGQYTYTPAAGFTGTTSVTYTICNSSLCTPSTITFTVFPVLIANSDTIVTSPSIQTSGSLISNDNGIVAGGSYSVSVSQLSPSTGTITVDPITWIYSFTPSPTFTGTANTTYTVYNVGVTPIASSSNTISINVGNFPIAMADDTTLTENISVIGNLGSNDIGAVGGTFSISQPSSGTGSVTVNAATGQYTYTPAAGFTGITSATYTLCNLNSPPCTSSSINFTVFPTLLANPDVIVTTSTLSATGVLTSNDNGILSSGTYSVSVNQVASSSGTITVDSATSQYTFTPNPTFTGSLTTSYTICNTSLNPSVCSSSTITINVGDFALAISDSAYTIKNVAVFGNIGSNDFFGAVAGGTFTISQPSVSSGTLIVNSSTGQYTFTPTSGFTGTTSATYTLCNLNSPPCSSATIKFTVFPTLVANQDNIVITQGSVAVGSLSVNDLGIQQDGIFAVNVGSLSASTGTITSDAATGNYTFTPNSSFAGFASLSYTICNTSVIPNMCSSSIININVGNLPIASADLQTTIANVIVTGDASSNDFPILFGPQTFSVSTVLPGGLKGPSRMRVITSDSPISSPTLSINSGEFEDYTLNIGLPSCADVRPNIENIMDYSSCPKMFTQGQVAKMRQSASSIISNRSLLVSDENLYNVGFFNTLTLTTFTNAPVPPSTVVTTYTAYVASNPTSATPCGPVADFASNKSTTCAGQSIIFNSTSYNSTPTSYSWVFEGGSPATSTLATQSVNYAVPGSYSVSLTVSNGNGSSTKTVNSFITAGWNAGLTTLPYSENFESGQWWPAGWVNINEDINTHTWQMSNYGAGTLSNSNHSLVLPNANYVSNFFPGFAGNVDIMETPNFDFTNTTNISLSFDYSFARKTSVAAAAAAAAAQVPPEPDPETFKLQYSTDCGGSWSNVLGSPTASQMVVSGGTVNAPYIPLSSLTTATNPNPKWVTKTIIPSLLTSINNKRDVKFRFYFMNDTEFGESQNLYIDNINISGTVGLNEFENSLGLSIYPNPTSSSAIIELTSPKDSKIDILVYDVTGRIVEQNSINALAGVNSKYSVNASSKLNSGIYFVTLIINNNKITKKLIID